MCYLPYVVASFLSLQQTTWEMQFKKRRGFFWLMVLEVSIQSWLSDFGPVAEKSWWEHGLNKLFTS